MNLIVEKKKSRFREHNFSLQWKSEGKIVSEPPIKKRIRPKVRQQKLFFGCAHFFKTLNQRKNPFFYSKLSK